MERKEVFLTRALRYELTLFEVGYTICEAEAHGKLSVWKAT